jgi:hypothetical protein
VLCLTPLLGSDRSVDVGDLRPILCLAESRQDHDHLVGRLPEGQPPGRAVKSHTQLVHTFGILQLLYVIPIRDAASDEVVVYVSHNPLVERKRKSVQPRLHLRL